MRQLHSVASPAQATAETPPAPKASVGGDVGGGGAGGGDVGLILTGSNADTEGRALTRRLAEFARNRDDAVFSLSLGQNLYLNALKQADAVVGNSSSGLYEAPSFRIPTVNIGDRQGGRLKAGSVIDCQPERAEILDAALAARRIGGQRAERQRVGDHLVQVVGGGQDNSRTFKS